MGFQQQAQDHLDQVRALQGDVIQECCDQIAKFGVQNHKPFEWLMILGEEVGETNKEALELHFNLDGSADDPARLAERLGKYRTEMIQVAAVALSAVAALDRAVG